MQDLIPPVPSGNSVCGCHDSQSSLIDSVALYSNSAFFAIPHQANLSRREGTVYGFAAVILSPFLTAAVTSV